MLIMIAQSNLDPSYVILGCFILIVLFLTGLIETAIQLFGNVSNVLFSLPYKPLPRLLLYLCLLNISIFLFDLHRTDIKIRAT